MNIKDILMFRKMITPWLVRIGFWIGAVIVILGGIIYFFVALIGGIGESDVGQMLLALFGVPIGTILLLLLLRLYAEISIVIFSINEALQEMAAAFRQRSM